MTAKNVESLRQKHAKTKIIRLFNTQPFIDDKWVKDRTKLKKYLVVKYSDIYEDYIPVWKIINQKKVSWWKPDYHDKIKKEIKSYNDEWKQSQKDNAKHIKARELFTKAKLTSYHTDDFHDAQDKYIEWCAKEGVVVDKMKLGDR